MIINILNICDKYFLINILNSQPCRTANYQYFFFNSTLYFYLCKLPEAFLNLASTNNGFLVSFIINLESVFSEHISQGSKITNYQLPTQPKIECCWLVACRQISLSSVNLLTSKEDWPFLGMKDTRIDRRKQIHDFLIAGRIAMFDSVETLSRGTAGKLNNACTESG